MIRRLFASDGWMVLPPPFGCYFGILSPYLTLRHWRESAATLLSLWGPLHPSLRKEAGDETIVLQPLTSSTSFPPLSGCIVSLETKVFSFDLCSVLVLYIYLKKVCKFRFVLGVWKEQIISNLNFVFLYILFESNSIYWRSCGLFTFVKIFF